MLMVKAFSIKKNTVFLDLLFDLNFKLLTLHTLYVTVSSGPLQMLTGQEKIFTITTPQPLGQIKSCVEIIQIMLFNTETFVAMASKGNKITTERVPTLNCLNHIYLNVKDTGLVIFKRFWRALYCFVGIDKSVRTNTDDKYMFIFRYISTKKGS